MNQDILRGKWNQLRGNVRKKWGKLTDDDLAKIQGNAEIMIGVIQERYGCARDQAEREINEFVSSSNVGGGSQPRPTNQPGQTQQRKDQHMTGSEPSGQRGPMGQRQTEHPTTQTGHSREDDEKRRRVS